MAIKIEADVNNRTIVVTFSKQDAVMATRNGMDWLQSQLGHIVTPRGKQQDG